MPTSIAVTRTRLLSDDEQVLTLPELPLLLSMEPSLALPPLLDPLLDPLLPEPPLDSDFAPELDPELALAPEGCVPPSDPGLIPELVAASTGPDPDDEARGDEHATAKTALPCTIDRRCRRATATSE